MSPHDSALEYENMRQEAARLRRAVADRDEFLEIIHHTRMFEIWREHRAGYRRLGVGK
jgi:hypothetical protein